MSFCAARSQSTMDMAQSCSRAADHLIHHEARLHSIHCTSAAGETVLVQIVWQGKTNQVHVDEVHPLVMQQHREGSHFQNADTFAEWKVEMVSRIAAIRKREGIADDVRAIMFLDQAPQHSQSDNHWILIDIPKKMTHVFQPADQHIIANVKKFTKCAWRGFLQHCFRDGRQELRHRGRT